MSISFFIRTYSPEVKPKPLKIPYVSFVKECPIIVFSSKHSLKVSHMCLWFDLKPSNIYIFFPVDT